MLRSAWVCLVMCTFVWRCRSDVSGTSSSGACSRAQGGFRCSEDSTINVGEGCVLTTLSIVVDADNCNVTVINVFIGSLTVSSASTKNWTGTSISFVNITSTSDDETIPVIVFKDNCLAYSISTTIIVAGVRGAIAASSLLNGSLNSSAAFSATTIAGNGNDIGPCVDAVNCSLCFTRVRVLQGGLNSLLNRSMNSSVLLENVTFEVANQTSGSLWAQSSENAQLTLRDVLIGGGNKTLEEMCKSAIGCSIAVSNLSSLPSASQLFLNAGQYGTNVNMVFEDIGPVVDFLGSACAAASNCHVVIDRLHDAANSVKSFGFKSLALSNKSLFISNSWNLNGTVVGACSLSTVCSMTAVNISNISSNSFSFVGFASTNTVIRISGVVNSTNSLLAPFFAASTGCLLQLSNVTNVQGNFIGATASTANAIAVLCGTSAATCILVMSFASSQISLWVSNVAGISNDVVFSAVGNRTSALDITFTNVSYVNRTMPLMFQGLGYFSTGARVTFINTCVSGSLMEAVSGTSWLTLNFTESSTSCAWEGGVLNVSSSAHYVNLSLGSLPKSTPKFLSVTGSQTLTLAGASRSLPLSIIARGAGLTALTIDEGIGSFVDYVDASNNVMPTAAVRALLRSLAAMPNAMFLSVSGNPGLINSTLAPNDTRSGPRGCVVVLSSASAMPTGLQLMYQCGDQFNTTIAVFNNLHVGNWTGWNPPASGRALARQPWHSNVGPCECLESSTWSLTLPRSQWKCFRSHTPTDTSTMPLPANPIRESRSESVSLSALTTKTTTVALAPPTAACVSTSPVISLSPSTLTVSQLASGCVFNFTLEKGYWWASSAASLIVVSAAPDASSVSLAAAVDQLTAPSAFTIDVHRPWLSIRLNAAPGLSIPGPQNATLVFQFGEGAVGCSGVPAFALSVAVLPLVQPILAVTQATALASAAIGTLTLSVNAAALVDIATMAALSSVKCGSLAGQAMAQRTSWVLSPFAVGEGAEGAVWGFLVIYGVLVGAQLVAVALIYVYKRAKRVHSPNTSSRASNSLDRAPHDARTVTPLRAALAAARCPGLFYNIALSGETGLALNAATLVLTGNVSAAALVGLLCVTALPVTTLYGARRWAAATFDIDAGTLIFCKYESIIISMLGAPQQRKATILRRLLAFAAPVGRWGPNAVAQMMSQPYRLLRPVWVSFAIAPSLQALLIGVITALPVRPTDVALCAMQYGGIAVVIVIVAVSGLVAQPYTMAIYTWLQLVSSMVLLLTVASNLGMLRQQAIGESPGGWLWVAEIALLLQSGVIAVKCILCVSVKIGEAVLWQNDGRRVTWIEGMVPHVLEHLDRGPLESFLAVELSSVAALYENTQRRSKVNAREIGAVAQSMAAGITQGIA